MKTLFTLRNVLNDVIHLVRTPKHPDASVDCAPHRRHHGEGDRNRNANLADAEFDRDACEEELYRLRYALEHLLANRDQGDLPLRKARMADFHRGQNSSWLDRCSPCCRRWRRTRTVNRRYTPNDYGDRYHSDAPNTRQSRRSAAPLDGDSIASATPSPSVSSPYLRTNKDRSKSKLRRTVESFIPSGKSGRTGLSDWIKAKGGSDPSIDPLILQMLEMKALDCICADYSKENTRKQIQKAMAELNSRSAKNQWGPMTMASDGSVQSSASTSSVLSAGQSLSSRSVPRKSVSSALPRSPASKANSESSAALSRGHGKDQEKSALRVNDNVKSPRKKSKVTIVTKKPSKSRKSNSKKRPSSRQGRKTPRSARRSKRSGSATKTASKGRSPSRKRSSSRRKTSKGALKSPSRSASRGKTSKSSKRSGTSKKRRGKRKPKSNNYANDQESLTLPTVICLPSCREIYRNREEILKLLLASV